MTPEPPLRPLHSIAHVHVILAWQRSFIWQSLIIFGERPVMSVHSLRVCPESVAAWDGAAHLELPVLEVETGVHRTHFPLPQLVAVAASQPPPTESCETFLCTHKRASTGPLAVPRGGLEAPHGCHRSSGVLLLPHSPPRSIPKLSQGGRAGPRAPPAA
jgi:hypothetical protein